MRVLIDNRLTFSEYVSSGKLHVLARISKYMTKEKL